MLWVTPAVRPPETRKASELTSEETIVKGTDESSAQNAVKLWRSSLKLCTQPSFKSGRTGVLPSAQRPKARSAKVEVNASADTSVMVRSKAPAPVSEKPSTPTSA